MTAVQAIGSAVVFVWLGMVLAISFLEAPLKFRAPGVTLPIGLGIGRLVFKALNIVESVLAATLVVLWLLSRSVGTANVLVGVAVLCVVLQVLMVRPRLTRRSDAVLAGETGPRSHAHHAYVALELCKVTALVAGGVLLLVSIS